ncbi:signal peptidase I [Rhodoferax sp. AJA081-3]|uniref:signal peptidase I n=1 Tax=Rhodoferax sp. AJA081-3 TaxID=2752316 RepID=UPI001ADFEE27|nr:signal peptidase I [Rhodoferax sp. AJA081-3]QTN26686.1 signal peptidase I [Rhodoferax sp. AJA081-3]
MKNFLKQNRGFIAFLICFGFFRLAIADWNPIPTGSMRPNILEGDVVLVNRVAYDFKLPLSDVALFSTGDPARGDVITFTSPTDGIRLIKRLVALPGDVVEMRDEVLTINGAVAEYSGPDAVTERLDNGATTSALRIRERVAGNERTVQFLPEMGAKRNFGPLVVPKDNYFFLGDNRDNSADSRYIGFVPRHLLVGKAHHIVVSAAIKDDWLPRLERTGQRIE